MAATGKGDPVGIALLGSLGIIWGATFPIARLGIDAGADPFLLVALDLLLASGVTALISVVRRSPRPGGRSLLDSLLIGALLIGGINLPLFWGEQFSTGGAAAIIYATSPLVSVVAARSIGARVQIGGWQRAALPVGLLGVIVLGLTSVGTDVLANGWALAAFALGAVCQGTGTVLLSRVKPEGESPWGLSFQFVGGLIAATLMLPLVASTLRVPDVPGVVLSVLFVGLGTLVAGYLIFFELVRRLGPVRANTVTFVNPVVALIVGVVAFRESFQWFELAGLAIVLVALGLIEGPESVTGRPERRRGSPSTGESPASFEERVGERRED